jgi:REP element-mobilizing transposase RayT
MARAWRIEFEGACYHLLSRGNERRDIFLSDDDQRLFLDTLGECCERFELELFAYVLMSNHYHLLLRTRRANLSRAMQWLSGTYTRRFNNRHGRSGHLFQGRFKSILVENDAYVMQLSCYIHRNPLRAGIVERLADYPWSSYPVYAYGKKPPDWLSIKLILNQFNVDNPHRAYREKVQRYAQEEERLWEDFRHGFILGSRKFVESIRDRFLPERPAAEVPQQMHLAKDKEVQEILKAAAWAIGCDLAGLASARRVSGGEKEKRDMLIYWVWKSGLLTNGQIGNLFGFTYSAVSHSVREMKKKLRSNKELRTRFAFLNSQFKL